MPCGNEKMEATRRSLLGRLKNWEDQVSWSDFFNRYWRLIYSTARKAGLNDAEAQDAVQDTILGVVENIKDFQYDRKRCTFKSWLMLLTRQRIAWQFRKRQKNIAAPFPREGAETSTVARIPNPAEPVLESIWDEEWRKNILSAALERIKRQVKPRQFQMFELYTLENWPVKDVAATLQVSAMQVYLAKHRISRLLQTEIRRLEEQPT